MGSSWYSGAKSWYGRAEMKSEKRLEFWDRQFRAGVFGALLMRAGGGAELEITGLG